MGDRFGAASEDLLGPATKAVAITPSDTTDLENVSKRLWIGGAGNVALITAGGDTVTYNSVPAGTYLNVRATRVKFTGTSATNIVAEY